MNFIRKFARNNKAVSLMGVGLAIIGLVIGITVAAELLPTALVDLTNETNYTGAPTGVSLMMTTVLGICVAAAVIMIVLRAAGKR